MLCVHVAARDNARVYLEATPAGKGLYRQLVWEEIDEIFFHLEEYGESVILSHQFANETVITCNWLVSFSSLKICASPTARFFLLKFSF